MQRLESEHRKMPPEQSEGASEKRSLKPQMSNAEKLFLFLLILLLPSQLALHLWPSWSLVSGLPVDYLSPTLYFTDLLIFSLLFLSRPRLSIPLPVIILCTLNILFSISPLVSLSKWLRLLEYYWLYRYLVTRLPYFLSLVSQSLSLAVIWSSFLAWSQFIAQRSLGGLWAWLGERPLSPASPGIAKFVGFNFNWLIGQMTTGSLWLRPYATMPHPNALAGFLLVATLLILSVPHSLKFPPLKLRRGLGGVIALAIILALLTVPLTFSRSAFFLEMVLLVTWLLAKIGTRLLPLIIPIALLLAGALTTTGNPSSLHERIWLIHKSIFTTYHAPLFGIGLGTFPAYQDYQLSTANFQLNYQPVHNVFLLLSSELGVPALALVAFWVFKTIKHSWFIGHRLLVVTLVVVLATGSVDHYWLTLHQNILLLTVLLALIAIKSPSL